MNYKEYLNIINIEQCLRLGFISVEEASELIKEETSIDLPIRREVKEKGLLID